MFQNLVNLYWVLCCRAESDVDYNPCQSMIHGIEIAAGEFSGAAGNFFLFDDLNDLGILLDHLIKYDSFTHFKDAEEVEVLQIYGVESRTIILSWIWPD